VQMGVGYGSDHNVWLYRDNKGEGGRPGSVPTFCGVMVEIAGSVAPYDALIVIEDDVGCVNGIVTSEHELVGSTNFMKEL